MAARRPADTGKLGELGEFGELGELASGELASGELAPFGRPVARQRQRRRQRRRLSPPRDQAGGHKFSASTGEPPQSSSL